jgi:hypothetical protein
LRSSQKDIFGSATRFSATSHSIEEAQHKAKVEVSLQQEGTMSKVSIVTTGAVALASVAAYAWYQSKKPKA